MNRKRTMTPRLAPNSQYSSPASGAEELSPALQRWVSIVLGTESPRDGRIRVGAALLVVVLMVMGVTACSSEKNHAPPAPEVVRGITLFTAQRTTVPDFVEATGTVRASQSAQLSSQVMGTITRVNVHEGDRVRRGEVLITIDEAQQRAAYGGANAGLQASQENIAAANADYALAESTMKRYQMLYDKKSVSPQEFDEVKTKLAAAKA